MGYLDRARWQVLRSPGSGRLSVRKSMLYEEVRSDGDGVTGTGLLVQRSYTGVWKAPCHGCYG